MPVQLDLYEKTHYQRFCEWLQTEPGRQVADRFIRIAYGCMMRRRKIGAKAIVERLRWHYHIVRDLGEEYAINNNYTAYLARFAMEREPRLQDFFETRATGADPAPAAQRGFFVTIHRKPAIPYKK